MLVTWDAIALFTNIKHRQGLASLKNALDKRENPKVPTNYLVSLMEIILKHNIFEFHESLWKQEIGAAMGGRPIPGYANIFMSGFDEEIKKIAAKYSEHYSEALQLLKRFLDDYIALFVGSSKRLHQLLEEINLINPSIQLTMNHTSIINEAPEEKCECKSVSSIPFLDTQLSIKEGKIYIDLFKKETDRNQYLLPSSCHSKMTTKAIPYSLALRIQRICIDPTKIETIFMELKNNLLDRKYPTTIIDSAIDRARKVPRAAALRKVVKKDIYKGPIFVVTYDPRLPPLGSIQAKHWRSMASRDTYLAEVFKRPPLIAFKRQ